MSVTEHPVAPTPDALATVTPLDPKAAIELAHELVLITRATFAQLLPETAERAVSGVPGLGVSVAAVPHQAATPAVPTLSLAVPTVIVPHAASVSAPPTPSVAAPPVTAAAVTEPSTLETPVAPVAEAPVSAPAPATTPPPIALPLVAAVEPTNATDSLREAEPITPTLAVALSVPSVAAPTVTPLDYVPVPGVVSPMTAPIPAAVPVEAVQPVDEIPNAVEPPAPHRSLHPSLAMLEEIGFLDE